MKITELEKSKPGRYYYVDLICGGITKFDMIDCTVTTEVTKTNHGNILTNIYSIHCKNGLELKLAFDYYGNCCNQLIFDNLDDAKNVFIEPINKEIENLEKEIIGKKEHIKLIKEYTPKEIIQL